MTARRASSARPVIRAVGEARTDLLRLERLSDEELAEIETQFDDLRSSEGA